MHSKNRNELDKINNLYECQISIVYNGLLKQRVI